MIKVLLYNDKIFLNARSFYEFMIINSYDGIAPNNWNLDYIYVCFSNKLNTVAGVKVDWISITSDKHLELKNSKDGWLRYSGGQDISFAEFVRTVHDEFTREDLWRTVIEYVITYDIPRSRMKRLVDQVMSESEPRYKKNGVYLYKLKD